MQALFKTLTGYEITNHYNLDLHPNIALVIAYHRQTLRNLAKSKQSKALFNLSDDLRTELAELGLHIEDLSTDVSTVYVVVL